MCEQCHLFGAARLPLRPGYQAGANLGDYLAIYAYEAPDSSRPSVTGHPEEMKQSACWRLSNGRLWCGSCHQVHAEVSTAEVAPGYDARCLVCHSRQSCNRVRATVEKMNREDDCISCHMPKRQVVESAHVAFTDHRILRRPRPGPAAARAPDKLKLIVPAELDDPVAATRNLGFAYAQLAGSTGRAEFNRRAAALLRPLAGTHAEDAPFWEIIGAAHLELDEPEPAAEAFRKALEKDPRSAAAHYSLGFLLQRAGRAVEAVAAYRAALESDPDKAEALGNLAAAYFALGRRTEALAALDAALTLEPGNLKWRAMRAGAAR
ncbi:MAG: tetratricopeptide repeat protein [Bryobacteraceae bacterium]|nr:tetratricopeptide repeat protein [Bryobacteraceae bacterium]